MGPDSFCEHDIKGTPALFLFSAYVQEVTLCVTLHKHTYWLLLCFGENKHILQLKTYRS